MLLTRILAYDYEILVNYVYYIFIHDIMNLVLFQWKWIAIKVWAKVCVSYFKRTYLLAFLFTIITLLAMYQTSPNQGRYYA